MQGHIETASENAGRSGARSVKLVVLGATGGTGLELVRQAIERGHSVTDRFEIARALDADAAYLRDRPDLIEGQLPRRRLIRRRSKPVHHQLPEG